jgi:hypothetical protein
MLHHNSLSCHTYIIITPHCCCSILSIHLPLVDWHVKGLGRLDELLWIALPKVSYQPPRGIIVSVSKLTVVVFFLFIVSD